MKGVIQTPGFSRIWSVFNPSNSPVSKNRVVGKLAGSSCRLVLVFSASKASI